MQIDDIVVGSGLWGCTVARILAERGDRVLVLERRDGIGGNSRCDIDPETGIEVHKFGPHIFHTNDEQVWRFMCRFTEFNRYQHKVLAIHNNVSYFMPFGLALVNRFYGLNLTPSEMPGFIRSEVEHSMESGTDPEANFETKAVSLIGRPLYEAFMAGYTEKQWGVHPSRLPSEIVRRIPVRSSYDLSYFNGDRWQGIPLNGYGAMFRSMLDHPNITVETGVDWRTWKVGKPKELTEKVRTFYSGALDELFGYRFGVLPWRSLRFEFETLDMADFQGTSIVNYVDRDVPFTRIHEYKHFHPEQTEAMNLGKTIICREYPDEWKVGKEAYYPIASAESREVLALYQNEARQQMPNLVVGGRCGEYKYYDMDKVAKSAMDLLKYN